MQEAVATSRSRARVERLRGLSQRATARDLKHKLPTPGESELGVTVQPHPGPSSGRESWQTHSLEGGPDVLSAVHNVCRHDI